MLNNNVSQSNTGMQQSIGSSISPSVTTNSSTPVNSTAGLEKGQLIRGEIVDLRSHEVSVKLDDGRILNAKIEESTNLAIGEKVIFRVEEVSLKNLTLKIIADAQYIVQDNTIDKAIDAAGLGKNDHNRAIVEELLKQQMSIDKKTISLLIQQSIMNKDSSIESLVLMNKYHIPITEGNINQMEAYRNMDQCMMNEIGNLADSIPNLFTQVSDQPFPDFLAQSKDLLNLLLNNKMNIPSDSIANGLSQNVPEVLINSNLITTGSLLSPKDCLALAQTLELASSSESLVSQDLLLLIRNGSADISEVAHLLNQLMDKEATGATSSLNISQSSSAAQTILTAYQNLQYDNTEIGSFLDSSSRNNLLSTLDSFALPIEIKDRIASGYISSHDLLLLIQSEIGSSSESIAKNLLSSEEYKLLIKEEILAKWTMTPESLTKEGEIDKHFQSLSNQVTELTQFMEHSSNRDLGAASSQANHLQESIQFMKTLNELFTYIQLPLKLKNQNAHSELYVYTKKKEGRTAADGISVLLHLDMDHLGPLDVHIDLHYNNIVSKFYLNDENTIDLIASHIPILEQSLLAKGFTLNAEILKREKDIDIVEDFIKQDAPSPSVKRYNFDIRA